jgi:ClpX C4-type zinc finger protein
MDRRHLACSFCGKNEDQVEKLVAGPRVYICDRCVAIAVRLMGEPPPPDTRPTRGWLSSVLLRHWSRHRRHDVERRAVWPATA